MRWFIPTAAGAVGGFAALLLSGHPLWDWSVQGLNVFVFGAALPWTLIHASSLLDSDRRGWPDKAARTIVVRA